jgi:signal transduction histidine kinase/putative methionine-R-sulfoxide reductase with GAF domain
MPFTDHLPFLSSAPPRKGWVPSAVVWMYVAGASFCYLFYPFFLITSRQLQLQPIGDQLGGFTIPYLSGLIFLVIGIYVFNLRRDDPAGRAFSLFCGSSAVALTGIYGARFDIRLATIEVIAIAAAGGALWDLGVIFPDRLRSLGRFPYLRWLGYVYAGLVTMIALLQWGNGLTRIPFSILVRSSCSGLFLSGVLFAGLNLHRRYRSYSPVVREQARLAVSGAALAILALLAWSIVILWDGNALYASILLLPLGSLPTLVAYTMLRYRPSSSDLTLNRAALYTLISAISIAAYILLVSGLSQILGKGFQPDNPILIGGMVIWLALAINPLKTALQNRIDAVFSRSQVAYRSEQQAFTRELTQAMELPQIINALRNYVDKVMPAPPSHIFIYDSFLGHYVATRDAQDQPTSDVHFSANSALVRLLSNQSQAVRLKIGEDFPESLKPEEARLALVGAQLFVPLAERRRLIGWLALGPKRSMEPYTQGDMNYLQGLCDQATLAIERAQVVTDLERRVRELNVLTRIAQGISFTTALDDILELLSAQTNQILPTKDYRITIFDQDAQVCSHAFFVQENERLSEFENRPIPEGRGLEGQIIASGRAILTDNYDRECRERSTSPDMPGVYAWIGVPMNAGAETIGAICMGSRDPTILYTEEQRNLLQAIADQASGAMVKARLLEETESRAQQLATLNEIGIGLTSTLDVKILLSKILDSATEILDCEAGSLILVDEETDELVFEVVKGPVAEELFGQRLPPGTGIAGQAVITEKPIIANDVKRRKEWYSLTDQLTGFDTQDLMSVPMRMQDRVIGVIEVVNKRDSAPFTQADQELLIAFTSQATIAIENARLYTLTDRALTDRVEELSVMQRIDRELNASLDIERVMHITLQWALRQTHFEAGLVGVVEEEGLKVMVHSGYEEVFAIQPPSADGFRDLLPLVSPMMEQAILTGQPRCVPAEEPQTGQPFGLLTGCRMQIIIPIHREMTPIGFLLLESSQNESPPEELIGFLSRLANHAAIAISNAQLYEEVKDANLAKSRFVSFIAHELKSPMSSIKGYAELVESGMAGPVNPMQASFLGTVRSNVDRMNTLVSDLNDLTKIQVGNLRLDFHAVKIHEVVEEIVTSFDRSIKEKEQELIVVLPEDLPMVWADSARLNQILTNLVSNAHKYTGKGGQINIGAATLPHEESSTTGVDYVQIWVKDQGIGISEKDQEQIFGLYFRADTAKEMASGTGLGLNISKSLVEMHGGKIRFESCLGEGTTFYFTVPVAEV